MVINVKPNKGFVTINLYGKDFKIEEKKFKEGLYILEAFGETYELKMKAPKLQKKAKKSKQIKVESH